MTTATASGCHRSPLTGDQQIEWTEPPPPPMENGSKSPTPPPAMPPATTSSDSSAAAAAPSIFASTSSPFHPPPPPPPVIPLCLPSPLPPTSASSSSASSSSQFAAANLFGLFERLANGVGLDTSFDVGNLPEQMASIQNGTTMCTMPTASTTTNSSSALSSFHNNDNDNNCSHSHSQQPPRQHQTPAIDKLLQISQQFLSNNENNAIIGGGGMGRKNANAGGGAAQRRSNNNRGTPPAGDEGSGSNDGANRNGPSRSGGNDRKRSYPYTFQFCVLCQKNVHSSKLPCHIRQCHVGKPMFQCPVCDFTSTYSKNNVKSHMVSLHGLAGDPISYMDQYASQVEEFMKQCFPNVRGRGRPLHGRMSPNAKQQQLASLTTTSTTASPAKNSSAGTVYSSGSSDVSASPSSSTLMMTPTQQRRHHQSSSSVANSPFHSRGGAGCRQQRATTGGGAHSQQRGTDNAQGGGQSVPIGGGSQSSVSAGGALPSFNPSDMYMGMLAGTIGGQQGAMSAIPGGLFPGARVQQPLVSPKDFRGSDKGFSLFNGFSPTFNPFVYLQQLNNLFTANNANSTASQFPEGGGKSDNFMPKAATLQVEMDMAIDENEQQQQVNNTNSTLFSLEECLNLSQKFLKEMSKDEPSVVQNDPKCEVAKEVLICHSSSSTASPPSSNCFPVSSNSDSMMADFREEEPRYFPQQLHLSVLDGRRLDKTVFKTFTNSNELIEKFDLAAFELLFEHTSDSLLTSAQRQSVSSVRKQLGLKSFEIMFAVHRLDIDVLKSENVHLVTRIAPTKMDNRRFHLFEQSNQLNSLDEDEQFVIQLSKIDRLREKLAVMALMGEFDERVSQLNQQLSNYSAAAKLLYNSAEFHTLLQLLLACANLINGDFTAQLVKGFRPHRLPEMCAFRFPNGLSLLEVMAQILRKNFATELCTFASRCTLVEEAPKVEFAHFHRELHLLEKGQSMVAEELQLCEGKNQQLANFLTHCELECVQLKEAIQSTKNQLISTMEFFGEFQEEPMGSDAAAGQQQCRPELFFSGIAQFVRDLRRATIDSAAG